MKDLPLSIINHNEPYVISKYAQDHNFDLSEAQTHFKEVKRFLWLCANMNEPLTPSPIVDELWHEFIVHTMRYQKFCREKLGVFIHHNPTDSPMTDTYSKTRELIESYFGQIDKKLWPKYDAANCNAPAQCSSCQAAPELANIAKCKINPPDCNGCQAQPIEYRKQ